MIRSERFNADVIGLLAVLHAAVLLAGCASIGMPSGGRRDEQPPRFVKANPAPGTRNFKGERVTIDFNEIVNIKDASSVVVSPPSREMPRVSALGRRVTVQFRDTLLPNTTYTIDFGSAIEDNNEGNKLENFSYTFSTGETLDSLRIAGMVLSSSELEPMQGQIVGVHRITADSAFTKLPFERVARTDDRGRFSIEGLAPGQYRLFALADADNNFKYSSPEEEMAWHDVLISPTVAEGEAVDSIYNLKTETLDTVVTRRRSIYLPNDILLRSFITDRKQPYVAAYTRKDSTRLELTFGAKLRRTPTFRLIDAPEMKDWYVMERSRTNDTISLWLSKPSVISRDTLRVEVGYQRLDSLDRYTAWADTLRFVTDRPKPVKGSKAKKKREEEQADTVAPPTPHMAFRLLNGSPLDVGKPLLIETEHPVAYIDSAAFRLEERKDTLWVPVGRIVPQRLDSLNPRRLTLQIPSDYGREFKLSIDTIAFRSIYGLDTSPQESEIKVRGESEYSALRIHLQGMPQGVPAFAELLSGADNIARREPVAGDRADFLNLLPGKYYLRLYLDYNGNGRYDTGDFSEHRQPEQVIYYPKTLNIKQNWEKEETWNVMETPFDLQKPYNLLKNKPTLRQGEKSPTDTDEEEEDSDTPQFYNNTRNSNNPGRRHSNSRLQGL